MKKSFLPNDPSSFTLTELVINEYMATTTSNISLTNESDLDFGRKSLQRCRRILLYGSAECRHINSDFTNYKFSLSDNTASARLLYSHAYAPYCRKI